MYVGKLKSLEECLEILEKYNTKILSLELIRFLSATENKEIEVPERIMAEGKLSGFNLKEEMFEWVVQKRWRAEREQRYYYINEFGEIEEDSEFDYNLSGERWGIGNYFETEKEAKNSHIYQGFKKQKEEMNV